MAPLGNPQKPILAKNYLIWAKDGKEDTFLVHFSEIAFTICMVLWADTARQGKNIFEFRKKWLILCHEIFQWA